MRFVFDAADNVVWLVADGECVDVMSLDDFRDTFGLRAVGALLRGK